MSRIIPFGKKSVTIEPHGVNDVVLRGHTYPLRFALRPKLDATWDSTTRCWIVHNATLDQVEEVIASAIQWVANDLAYRRSEGAKQAAITRRIRARRWNDKDRANFQSNYNKWVDAGRPVSSHYPWLKTRATHPEATCVECDAMLFMVTMYGGGPLVCYKCEAMRTS
jgi:hypothetical protein